MTARGAPSRRDLFAFRLGAPALEIDPTRCLARSFCATCVERCPVEGALVVDAGQPRITSACTACGVCERLCPAPGGAILRT